MPKEQRSERSGSVLEPDRAQNSALMSGEPVIYEGIIAATNCHFSAEATRTFCVCLHTGFLDPSRSLYSTVQC